MQQNFIMRRGMFCAVACRHPCCLAFRHLRCRCCSCFAPIRRMHGACPRLTGSRQPTVGRAVSKAHGSCSGPVLLMKLLHRCCGMAGFTLPVHHHFPARLGNPSPFSSITQAPAHSLCSQHSPCLLLLLPPGLTRPAACGPSCTTAAKMPCDNQCPTSALPSSAC